jgi:hypothetical protein
MGVVGVNYAGVVPGAPIDAVPQAPNDVQPVVALPTEDGVGTRSALDEIVPSARVDEVVPVSRSDPIPAAEAADRVGLGVPAEAVPLVVPSDRAHGRQNFTTIRLKSFPAEGSIGRFTLRSHL